MESSGLCPEMPQVSDDKVKVFDKGKEEMSLSPYCKNRSLLFLSSALEPWL